MIRIAAGFAAALALTGLSQAAEMQPMQATSISLGKVTGVAYYSVVGESFEIVATLAGEEGMPMRFVSTLVDGQKMRVSVPQAVDQAPIEVVFARFGDSLSVTDGASRTAMTN
jgi:hypothetical protein